MRYLILLAAALLITAGAVRFAPCHADAPAHANVHVLDAPRSAAARNPFSVRVENRGSAGRVRVFGYRMARPESRVIEYFPRTDPKIVCTVSDSAIAPHRILEFQLDDCRSADFEYLIVESGTPDAAGIAWRETDCYIPFLARSCLVSDKPHL